MASAEGKLPCNGTSKGKLLDQTRMNKKSNSRIRLKNMPALLMKRSTLSCELIFEFGKNQAFLPGPVT